MPPTTLTDEELVQKLRSQSRDAFGELYLRHKDALYDYCFHLLRNKGRAEDAVHEAFYMAWHDIHQLNHLRSFRAWIFSIARHHSFNDKRNQKPSDELSEEDLIDDDDPHSILVSNEQTAQFNDMLDSIRPAYKELIVLKEYEGLSYSEIANVIGLSLASVRVHLFRARRAFAKVYLRSYGENER
jgi:RNA polymerase sigma-70 factor, ECF subfamily